MAREAEAIQSVVSVSIQHAFDAYLRWEFSGPSAFSVILQECPSDISDQMGGWTTKGIGHGYGTG